MRVFGRARNARLVEEIAAELAQAEEESRRTDNGWPASSEPAFCALNTGKADETENMENVRF